MAAFQQKSTQQLVNKYKHMNSRNDRLDLRLNCLQREYYFINYGKTYVKLCNCCCFWSTATLQTEWSVAPSIFNIKARGLAHCLLWVKLGLEDAYVRGLLSVTVTALSDGRACKQYYYYYFSKLQKVRVLLGGK